MAWKQVAKMCIMNPWCYALYLEIHNYPAGKIPLSNFIFYFRVSTSGSFRQWAPKLAGFFYIFKLPSSFRPVALVTVFDHVLVSRFLVVFQAFLQIKSIHFRDPVGTSGSSVWPHLIFPPYKTFSTWIFLFPFNSLTPPPK